MHVGRSANKSKQQYTVVDKDGIRHVLDPTRLERDLGVLVSNWQTNVRQQPLLRGGSSKILINPSLHVADNCWNYSEKPLSNTHGPASSVRANTVRLNPPVRYRCKQRQHFFTSKVAAPFPELPIDIMNFRSVNIFKNAYDKTKILCQHQ